jgi:hypothetical protein
MDTGLKIAYYGLFSGLLFMFATFFVGLIWEWLTPYIFAGFIFCYVILPVYGMAYDLNSGDFEEREGYSP